MTDILVDDHAEVDTLLGGLAAAFEGGDAREILARLDYVWARLAVHIRAEHLCLFPALLAAAEREGAATGVPSPGEVRASVARLREDHDFFMRELAEAVNGARALAAGGGAADVGGLEAIRDRVLAVAERLGEHNRIEEGQVYLWPEALLGAEARARLGISMRREVENLPPRFSGGDPGS
jgi:hypothetical protein